MEPPAKRARLDPSGSATSLFAPFRALGHVSNEVPFAMGVHSAVGLQRPEFNIVSSLGRSWAMWGGKDMRVRFVGPEAAEPITSLAVHGNDVFAATGQQVLRYQRGRIAQAYSTAPNAGHVGEILIFGSQLVALEVSGERMWVWDLSDGSLYTTVQFSADFHAARLIHPATYINKVCVASREGSLQIWNTVTSSLIHTFAPATLSSRSASITALAQSPAVDVIAIGFDNGDAIAFDLGLGEQLFRVQTAIGAPAKSTAKASPSSERAVVALSFRTDNEGHTLACAAADGTMTIWDLEPLDDAMSDDEEERQPGRLLHLVRNAHEGRIGGLAWLPGQALLISSGADNSIKQWAFDSATAEPRLLKSRSGHTAPPSLLRYYGDDGKAILSAGSGSTGKPGVADDRSLRYTSVVRDSRSFELSQGSVASKAKHLHVSMASLRAPPVVAMHYSTARSRDWDDVVTCHTGESIGRTWTVENKRRGQWTFADAENDKQKGVVKCSCVSACGNFGLVGFSTGLVGLWNMQSGIRRRTFDTRTRAPADRHSQGVSGIVCDALNRKVVIGTQGGRLHWFDFHTGKHQGVLDLPAGISSLLLHRDNNLLAVTCDDMVVRIVDIETRRVVRELSAFRGRIIDVAFSPDSRWLIVASSDAVIRTFDLPTGRLVDAFRTPSCATSLSFSPTGDFLATSHVDSVGVFLWANRAQFAEVSLRTVAQEDAVPELRLPGFQGEDDVAPELEEYAAPTDWPDELDVPLASAEQISTQLVTLSAQPRSKWQTLLNLDTIRARNKPKEPPKLPERAPFFLPTLPGATGDARFDLAAAYGGGNEKETGKKKADEAGSRLAMSTASVRSETVELLLKAEAAGEYDRFFDHLFELSASALDLELRTLTPPDLAPLLRALTIRLKSHRDFEAVQAVLAVLLRVQGDVLIGLDDMPVGEGDDEGDDDLAADREEALQAMEALLVVQQAEAKRLGGLVGFALGALGFVRNAPSMA